MEANGTPTELMAATSRCLLAGVVALGMGRKPAWRLMRCGCQEWYHKVGKAMCPTVNAPLIDFVFSCLIIFLFVQFDWAKMIIVPSGILMEIPSVCVCEVHTSHQKKNQPAKHMVHNKRQCDRCSFPVIGKTHLLVVGIRQHSLDCW